MEKFSSENLTGFQSGLRRVFNGGQDMVSTIDAMADVSVAGAIPIHRSLEGTGRAPPAAHFTAGF